MTLTEAATVYIKNRLSKEQAIGLRLSIKKTGCSGYSYAPALVKEANVSDHMIEINGIKIFLDPLWQHLLENIALDYVEENKLGLKQKKLVFNNPAETSRCGCGESFHVEKGD